MRAYFKTQNGELYNGDCIDVMKELVQNQTKIHGVITSPPYNIFNTKAKDRGYDFYQDNKSDKEYIEWVREIFCLYEQLLDDDGVICFNMGYGTSNSHLMSLVIGDIIQNTNFQLVDIIVWKKNSAMPNTNPNRLTRICEFIYIFVKQDNVATFKTNKKLISHSEKINQDFYETIPNFIKAPNNDESTHLNKATFSTSLVNQLIDIYFPKGSTIMDNFNGTGTSFVACESKGMKYIGIELSKEQCEHTKDRIQKGVQQTLF